MRIALGVEYDGAPYCGWQSQSSACGVQDFLEQAIKNIAEHDVRIHAAGRTDAGVHAMMQVVHFDTETVRPDSAWVRGVNAFLPDSIRVVWAKMVDEEFHARFSATLRSYQYLLANSPTAPAIKARQAGWYHLQLNISAMQQAICYLQGEHDFSAFRASECQAKSPVKNLQVRNMVGALIYVGNGKHPPEFIKELLEQKNRTLSPPTFSPNGLYLVGVEYAKKFVLPNTQRALILI